MTGFVPVAPVSRSQRDAEADDARASELAGEFGQLLERRRETQARATYALAEARAIEDADGGGARRSGIPACDPSADVASGRVKGRRAGGSGDVASTLDEVAGLRDGQAARKMGSEDHSSRLASRRDGDSRDDRAEPPNRAPLDRTRARSASRQESVRVAADGSADARALETETLEASVEHRRSADDALVERSSARSRARASDDVPGSPGRRGEPVADSARSLDAMPPASIAGRAAIRSGEDDDIADRRIDRARGDVSSSPGMLTALAGAIIESLAKDGRGGEADAPGVWRFSLVDGDEDPPLAFVITHHGGGQLSVALDGEDRLPGALLDELAEGLAELDERIVLELPRG